MPKHTDLIATGQISSFPVQMGCTRCLVYLVPWHLKQILQKQLSDALWLEVFDLNPKWSFLKPKNHPTTSSSSAGSFSALKPTGVPVNANWGGWSRHIHYEANEIPKYIISLISCTKQGFGYKSTLEGRKKHETFAASGTHYCSAHAFFRSMFLLLMETFKFSLQTHYSSVSSSKTEFGEISNTTSILFPDRISLVCLEDFSRHVHWSLTRTHFGCSVTKSQMHSVLSKKKWVAEKRLSLV